MRYIMAALVCLASTAGAQEPDNIIFPTVLSSDCTPMIKAAKEKAAIALGTLMGQEAENNKKLSAWRTEEDNLRVWAQTGQISKADLDRRWAAAEAALTQLNSEAARFSRAIATAEDDLERVGDRALSECYDAAQRRKLDEMARKRAADAAAAQAKADRIAGFRANRKLVRIAGSAWLCVMAGRRRDVLAEIAAEKRYSRVGGVQNTTKLYGLQNGVREIDETISETRADLAAAKVKPLGCRDKGTAVVAACINGDPSVCEQGPLSDAYELAEADAE